VSNILKKRKILIPEPKSRFLLVQCVECENQQVIFDHASTEVPCIVCGRVLARPTGGKAEVLAKVIRVLE